MKLLAVDTASYMCSACLYDGAAEQVCILHAEDIGRGHAERLFPVIAETLAQSEHTFADLDRLAVCIGPGSFTGIRVGVAAMRGLALALDIPLIGIDVFDCMAAAAKTAGPALIVLDARRDEVYAQLYAADGAAIGPPSLMPGQQALELAQKHGATLVGPASSKLASEDATQVPTQDAPAAVDIAVLAALAAHREPSEKPTPLYLRAPDAKPQDGFALPRREAS